MPRYQLTDKRTGQQLTVERDQAPDDEGEIQNIFDGQPPPLVQAMQKGDLSGAVNMLGTSPNSAMVQSDINRGVLRGQKTPGAEQLTPTQLAQMDRYAWGRQGGLGGVPVAAGYEFLKSLAQSGIPALPQVASLMGFQNTANQFGQDPTSSPASFGNVAAYIRGALGR